MMKVYIASALHHREIAQEVAKILRFRNWNVVSTWHADRDATFQNERSLNHNEKARIANSCFRQIDDCDVLVWLHGKAGERYGAAMEAGFAIALRKQIVACPASGISANLMSDIPSILLLADYGQLPHAGTTTVFCYSKDDLYYRMSVSSKTETTYELPGGETRR